MVSESLRKFAIVGPGRDDVEEKEDDDGDEVAVADEEMEEAAVAMAQAEDRNRKKNFVRKSRALIPCKVCISY